jgi:hypothetical protein
MDSETSKYWKEHLPDNCPPSDARTPNNEIFFRLVTQSPPLENDFYSNRQLFPLKQFNASECVARSVSIFNCINTCKQIRKLPTHKNKFVARLRLSENAGVIKKSGRPKHYSWWIKNNFNAVAFSEIVNEES